MTLTIVADYGPQTQPLTIPGFAVEVAAYNNHNPVEFNPDATPADNLLTMTLVLQATT